MAWRTGRTVRPLWVKLLLTGSTSWPKRPKSAANRSALSYRLIFSPV
jgi:hypothetical protein